MINQIMLSECKKSLQKKFNWSKKNNMNMKCDIFNLSNTLTISNKSLKWYTHTHTHTHTHTQLVFAEPIFSADEVIHLSENPT